jgi:peroxiredoxin
MRLRAGVALWFLLPLLIPHLAAAQDSFKELQLIKPTRVQAARGFTVPTPDGKSIRLSDYRGKVVFLNFWATWCPPCKEEMPSMERLYQRFKTRGLVVLAVSVDAEGAQVVVPFVKEHKLTYAIGLDPKMTLALDYGVRGLPSSFFVDKKGNLAALAIGPREWDSTSARALIEFLLKQG